jgi:leucyl-tRNA synthetase
MKKTKEYILVEFPYPSGEGLHIGHAFTMTGADVYARKKRMEGIAKGFKVFFPIGYDAFGLPTENYAIKTGIKPQLATKQNTDTFRRQMKELSFSFDWDAEVITSNPDYYKWTQWIFIQLFKQGLAYKQKMPINWCPSCKIGLANEEVVDNKCERCGAPVEKKELDQWLLRITAYADRLIDDLETVDYPQSTKSAQINWIGRSNGALVDFQIDSQEAVKIKALKIFTTRPDTLWGATFMVIAPEHPLVDQIQSMKSISQEKKREIDNYVNEAVRKSDLERTELQKDKSGVDTGLTAINPANGKKISIWISDFVLSSYGTGAIMAVPAHDQRDWEFAKKFDLPIIPVIIPDSPWDFDKGAYADVEEGKLANSDFIDGLKPSQAMEKVILWLESKKLGRRSTSYHLRDWVFSRQHYWGEPIPMVFCKACQSKGITWWDTQKGKQFRPIYNLGEQEQKTLAGWFPIAEDDLPLKLPDIEKYQPTGTGKSPLADVREWVETSCPHCGGKAERETDTMPNWAGSSWYFLRFLDPRNNERLADFEKLKFWMPVDVYFGGEEHTTLHLLYSRFWNKFLYDLRVAPTSEPYQKRIVHGVILGPDGQRMSKSRGNVINPDDVARKYGSDALRMYLMFIGPYSGSAMAWNENSLKGVVRFLSRTEKYFAKSKGQTPAKGKAIINKLISKVSSDVDSFSFNTAVAAMMEALNGLEKNEIVLGKEEALSFIKLLSIFAPKTAEKLAEIIGKIDDLDQTDWPTANSKYLKEEYADIIVQVNGKVRGILNIEAAKSADEDAVRDLVRKDEKISKHVGQIEKAIFVPGKLINFVVR